MEPLVKEFIETTDTPTEVGELEVRFGKQRAKITKIKYDNVLGYLKGNGFRVTNKEVTLKILLSKVLIKIHFKVRLPIKRMID